MLAARPGTAGNADRDGRLELRNLPMLRGDGADLGLSHARPAGRPLVDRADSGAVERSRAIESEVLGALRATGTGLRVFDPIENRGAGSEANGRAWRDDRRSGAGELAVRRVVGGGAGALGSEVLDLASPRTPGPCVAGSRQASSSSQACSTTGRAIPAEILAILEGAQPLASESARPEEWTISVRPSNPPG